MKAYKYQREYDIFLKAQERAMIATNQHIADNPGQWFPCGFAWVQIKPARGRFVSMLKDKRIGRVDDYFGGYNIHNPSQNSTQWMDAKQMGAKAFVEVLIENGIRAEVNTRID